MNRFCILAACAVIALPIALTSSAAGSREPSQQYSVVGTWELASLYEEDERGQEALTFGLNPEGRLVLDAAGHFSLQIVDEMRWSGQCHRGNAMGPRAPSGPAMLAYFGTYSIDPKDREKNREKGRENNRDLGTIRLHIDHGLNLGSEASDRIADVTLAGDSMELVSSIVPSPTGANYSRLVWQRLR